MHLRLLPLLLVLIATFPTALYATTAADLCSVVADPCIVNGPVAISSGSVLDFGPRALRLTGTGDLLFPGGSVTVTAGSLTMFPGAKISGGSRTGGGNLVVRTTGPIDVQGGPPQARIDVSSNAIAGLIDLATSGGALTVDGAIAADGIGVAGEGGTILLRAAGNVTVTSGDLSATAGDRAIGGDIAVTSDTGTIDIGQIIDVSGGDGGGGFIELSGAVDVITRAKLDVGGGGFSGDGGFVSLLAGGTVQLLGPVDGPAAGNPVAGGGDGADVQISAIDGNAIVAGAITATGGAPDGSGGSLNIDAGLDIVHTGDSLVSGPGLDGCGGDVDLVARRNITISKADVSGGGCGAGTIAAQAAGTITAAGPLTGDSPDLGIGGFVFLRSATATVRGLVRANGPTATLRVQACTLNLTDTGTLRAVGTASLIDLQASGQMALRGAVQAGGQGTNQLTYRDPTKPPTFTPRLVSPGPTLTLDPALPPCAGATTTTTTTATSTSSTTSGTGSTSTSTSSSTTTTSLPGRLTFATRGSRTGCFLEWKLRNPGRASSNGMPSTTQACIDGDPACDLDGAADGTCTFEVAACLAATNPELPLCAPRSILSVDVQRPSPLAPADAAEQANAAALVDALGGLGAQVTSQRTVVRSGTVLRGRDLCTAPFPIKVSHAAGLVGKALLVGEAAGPDRQRQRRNRLTLVCAPNAGACGNGVAEVGEECDDGNTTPCDGCSGSCRLEGCGNGITECQEQCDSGPQNGAPGDPCGMRCTFAPPAERVPGGGPAKTDCQLGFGLTLSALATDRNGRPTAKQTCVDDDPTCDFDPTPGTCRWHVWLCAGDQHPATACPAALITRIQIDKPATGAAAQRLAAAVDELDLPSTGQVCTRRLDLDVPVGRDSLGIRTITTEAGGTNDRDQLRLVCSTPRRRPPR